VDLAAGELEITQGIGGSESTYLHEIALYIPGGPVKIKAAFKDGLPVAGLLGMQGFFEFFRVSFHPDSKVCEIDRLFGIGSIGVSMKDWREGPGYINLSVIRVSRPCHLSRWIRCTISNTFISLLAAIRRWQTEQWHSMTPGLVVSNRTTNGSSDNGGIQDSTSLVQCERLSKIQEDGPGASRFPPLSMLQNFLIPSIKRQLKMLIMNICCNRHDAAGRTSKLPVAILTFCSSTAWLLQYLPAAPAA
jgi:hypothetical protein